MALRPSLSEGLPFNELIQQKANVMPDHANEGVIIVFGSIIR
jgi:hypothetical protein